MLEPAYAWVSWRAAAGQLGNTSCLTDAVSGDSRPPRTRDRDAGALSGDDDGPLQARSYQVMNGIAVLPVSGTLVSRTRALQPYSGMTGYNGIIARLQQAASDPMVDGILLDMRMPRDGGGAFDCADIIARVRDIKPVRALANAMNCSAGQLLASAASRRLVTHTARTAPSAPLRLTAITVLRWRTGCGSCRSTAAAIRWMATRQRILLDDVRETLQSRGWTQPAGMFAQRRCRGYRPVRAGCAGYRGCSVQRSGGH